MPPVHEEDWWQSSWQQDHEVEWQKADDDDNARTQPHGLEAEHGYREFTSITTEATPPDTSDPRELRSAKRFKNS